MSKSKSIAPGLNSKGKGHKTAGSFSDEFATRSGDVIPKIQRADSVHN
jgi:hypothetical protein